MKTPEEIASENKGFLILEDHQASHELIRRIQADAQPKWVTGEDVEKCGDSRVPVLIQSNDGSYLTIIREFSPENAIPYYPACRFLRLDSILAQECPK